MLYQFFNKDGTLYTRIDTENPQMELEAIAEYNKEVIRFEEYIEPEPTPAPEEESEVLPND